MLKRPETLMVFRESVFSFSLSLQYLLICLATLGLSCSMQLVVCGMLFPDQGSNLGSLHCECRVREGGCGVCDQLVDNSSDWLVVRSSGVNIINLLGSTGLWVAWGQSLPSDGGFSLCKTAQSIWVRILSIALEEELKVLDLFNG